MSEPENEAWSARLQRLYDVAAGKPGAVEDHPWGETVFKVGGKIFIFLGCPPGRSVTVKARTEDLDGLLQLSNVQPAAYIGRYGWVRVAVDDDASLGLALDLLDQSYEQVRSKLPKRARQ